MSLEIKNLNISNQKLNIFQQFNLKVENGEVCSVMGPSGSGKSTLLSFVCGTIDNQSFFYSGKLFLDQIEISSWPIEKRRIGLLFQDDLLFPHMTVEENLAFAIPAKYNKMNRSQKIKNALESSQLTGYETRLPSTLSGGQRARISLLRTLLANPKALLLDEPFAKLDVPLKKKFKEFAFSFIKELNIPTILVTHDYKDILDNKKLIELTEPQEIIKKSSL